MGITDDVNIDEFSARNKTMSRGSGGGGGGKGKEDNFLWKMIYANKN